MQSLNLQLENLKVVVDISLIEDTLNRNLAKIADAIQLLQAQVSEQASYQRVVQQIQQSREDSLANWKNEIEVVKESQSLIVREVLGDVKNGPGGVSRISNMETQLQKIYQCFKQGSYHTLNESVTQEKRGSQMGKSNHDNSKGQRPMSRVSSRRRQRQNQKTQQAQESGTVQEVEMNTTKKLVRPDSIHLVRTENDTRQEAEQEHQSYGKTGTKEELSHIRTLYSQNQKRMQSELEKLLEAKLKVWQIDHLRKIKLLQKVEIDTVKTLQTVDSNKRSIESTNRQANDTLQSPDVYTNPLEIEFQSLRQRFKESHNHLQQVDMEHKETAKRTGDILISVQKNEQKTNSTLKYLQNNIHKLTLCLQELDILQSSTQIPQNTDRKPVQKNEKGQKGSKISKLLGIGDFAVHNPGMQIKIDALEALVKNLSTELRDVRTSLVKLEGRGFLPRIDDKQNINRCKQPSMDPAILQKVNFKLGELQSSMDRMNVKMKSMSDSNNQIPLRLMQLNAKIRQQGEIREQRLVQLIKELINRALTDPFNNNFTNCLKREISIKFLQIKHQYSGILKQIQKKVQDRADRKELQYLSTRHDIIISQLKSAVGRKAESEDTKKWSRFMEGKIKELFQIVKTGELNQSKLVQEHTLSIRRKS